MNAEEGQEKKYRAIVGCTGESTEPGGTPSSGYRSETFAELNLVGRSTEERAPPFTVGSNRRSERKSIVPGCPKTRGRNVKITAGCATASKGVAWRNEWTLRF